MKDSWGRLCHAADSKASFPVIDNSQLIAQIESTPEILYFLTGGAFFDGQAVMGIYDARVPYEGKPTLAVTNMPIIEVGQGAFLRQRRVFFEGDFFTCEDIIKYAANKLGGAHFDFARPGVYQKLDAAAAYMKYGGPALSEEELQSAVYLRLEPNGEEIISCIYAEIIAEANSLLNVKIGGQSVMDIRKKQTWLTRLQWFFGIDKSRLVVRAYGEDERTEHDTRAVPDL